MDDTKMGTMPVRPLLLRMAWPMMLSMLIQALYNLVDSMFVSRLSGAAFQALSLAYPVQMFMVAVCVGAGVGLNALLSKRLGQGDRAEARAVALNGIFLYLLCWLLFLSFGLFLTRPFMAFFTADPAIAAPGRTYLTIVTCVSVGMTMQFATERVLLACGDAVGPMVIQGVGAVVNLVMDPLLIFGPGPFPALGVAGAAVATVLGQLTGMTVGLLLLRRLRRLPLSPRGFRPRGDILAEICRVGIPAAAMQSLSSVMTLGLNKIMALRDLEGSSIDAATVTRAVRDMFKDPTDIMPTADVIIEEVCSFYNIENSALRGQGRTKDTALARQVAMYLIREMTNLSLKEIGREFENRDHTTVLHSIERIEKLKKTTPEISEVIKDIRANINARYE